MAEVYTTPVIPLRKFSNTKFKLSCSYGTSTAVNALDFSKGPSEMISHVSSFVYELLNRFSEFSYFKAK